LATASEAFSLLLFGASTRKTTSSSSVLYRCPSPSRQFSVEPRHSLESIFYFPLDEAPQKRHFSMLFAALSFDSQLTRRNAISIYVPMIVSQTGSCGHWPVTSCSLPRFRCALVGLFVASNWRARLLTRSHYPLSSSLFNSWSDKN
jgi:hypothetical protein